MEDTFSPSKKELIDRQQVGTLMRDTEYPNLFYGMESPYITIYLDSNYYDRNDILQIDDDLYIMIISEHALEIAPSIWKYYATLPILYKGIPYVLLKKGCVIKLVNHIYYENSTNKE